MSVLDLILKLDMIEDETVNATYTSTEIDISGVEEAYSVQVIWDSGSSPNMVLSLEATNTPDVVASWVPISDSSQAITGNTGSHIWDVSETGVGNLRVKIQVASGSADFSAVFSGKRRH
jgi:hypothetical protein